MTQRRGELSQLSGGGWPVHLFSYSRPWSFVRWDGHCLQLKNGGDSVIDQFHLRDNSEILCDDQTFKSESQG